MSFSLQLHAVNYEKYQKSKIFKKPFLFVYLKFIGVRYGIIVMFCEK